MTFRPTARRLAATVAATLISSLTVASIAVTPASAAGHEVYTTYDSVVSAKATFHSYGDWYSLDDLLPDWSGVTLQYKKKGGATQSMYWFGGTGQGAARYEEYKEGQVIYFRACSQNGPDGELRYCGDWKRATA